ncbi:MAG: fibronectin type III domain-containing protein [Ramlibacter sp.]|nr:fibronectin type III domain-containing protein [Ramlibacter sp.]
MLTVELVNDSDRTDDQVFLLLTGTAVSATGGITTLQLPQATGASVTAGAMSTLTASGTLASTQTGQTCNIYPIEVSTLTSGRLLVSLDSALVYADNAAPTATSQTMRWDKLEFGYPGSGADLTSIDFFGVPLQFEYLDASGHVLTTMTYYTSTPTLLNAVYQLNTATLPAAFQQASGNTLSYNWTPGTDPLSSFVRLVGPQTLTALNGAPAPYPSFGAYLAQLAASGTSFTLNGIGGVGSPAPANNSVSYSYTGTVASDGAGGYLVAFTGTTTGVAPNTANTPYGLSTSASGVTTFEALPANLPVTLTLPAGSFDNDIYGAEASAYTVGQSSDASAPDYLAPDLVVYSQNSAYANIAGDFIAALHFGYPGGNAGANSSAWYSNPPMAYPFGGARTTNDGFYNPFAAVLYNLSDAYGFPFSDRGGRPSPYVPLPANATTMRVTILNDHRLDAPQVTQITPTDTTLALSWDAVTAPTGFTLTGYSVAISPPAPGGNQTVAAGTTSASFTGLDPCTRYTLSVSATGTGAGGNAVQSYTIPVAGTTTGSVTPLAGDINFLMSLNWGSTGSAPAGTQFSINGTVFTPSATAAPVTVLGSAGLNTVPLQMLNSAGDVVYSGNYAITLAGTNASYTVGSPFELAGNSQPLSVAGPPGTPPYNGTAAAGQYLSVGTPFAPVPDKQVNPVTLPAP